MDLPCVAFPITHHPPCFFEQVVLQGQVGFAFVFDRR